MRITIHGSYGTGNRGDNSILYQLLHLLEGLVPQAELSILCRDVRRVSLFISTEFPDSPLRFRLLPVSFRKQPLQVLGACLGCDLFILGGGGLLWGRAPGNLSYWLLRPRLAKLAGKRLVFYVPGVYGIQGRRALRLLRGTALKADFISVRDTEGLKQLKDAGVPAERVLEGADPAFLLPPASEERTRSLLDALGLEDKRLVGLSARDWRARLSAGIFAKCVQHILSDDNTVLLFFVYKSGGFLGETDTDDLNVAGSLLRTLDPDTAKRVVIVDDNYSIAEFIALTGACDFLIGMRLHSLIFATIVGTPMGAVAYDDKISAYMRMIGREDFVLTMKDVTNPDMVDHLVEKLSEERRRLGEGRVAEIRARAAGMTELAENVHRRLAKHMREWFPSEVSGEDPS